MEIEGIDKSLYTDNSLINKILGCLYGQAIADAYGLSTEFLKKKEIQTIYPSKDTLIPFPNYVTNKHNVRWTKGDFTDDTDQMILIMQMFTESNGNVDIQLLARKLRGWIKKGFSECGDFSGMGIGQTTFQVSSHPEFENVPLEVSKSFWIKTNKSMAANGALMRTSIVGCVASDKPDIVRENTIKCCKFTHYDPRCIISCTTATEIISNLIQIDNQIQQKEVEKIISQSMESARTILYDSCKLINEDSKDLFYKEYYNHMNVKDFTELKLDEDDKIGYTYKCLGSGIFCLRQYFKMKAVKDQVKSDPEIFRSIINKLIKEGGDSDTNGSISGALLGCLVGFTGLPSDMISELPYKLFLDKYISKFINTVVLNKSVEFKLPQTHENEEKEEYSVDLKFQKNNDKEEDDKEDKEDNNYCLIQ